MKKIPLYTLLLFVAVLGGIGLYACGGDSAAPTVTLNKESGETISISDKIVATFSKSMDTDSLVLGGTMGAASDGGVWSTDKVTNDTLTISPTDTWDASAPGTLTIAASDKDKKDLKDQSLTYGIQITFSNFQAASVVIGQADFVSNSSNQGGSVAANTIDSPYGNPAFFEGALFVSDYSNNRSLKFNTVPTTNNKNANVVIGQSDFVSSSGGNAANASNGPEGVQVYGDKLYTLEYSNNAINIYNTIPTTSHPSANIIVGQTAFGIGSSGCTSATLNNPEGFYIADGKLIVTDSSNNRVLIWNTIPTTNGKAADVVLGQADFTHCTQNDADQDGMDDGVAAAKTMYYPAGAWSDGTKLVVADGDNNRVLIWNTFPTTNFKAPDLVLGQADFVSNSSNAGGSASAKSMDFPYFGVYSNGTQLFISDEGNSRVLIWNTFPTTSYKAADVVLGQADFTHSAGNDTNNDGSSDSPSAKTLNYPSGLMVFQNKLIVTDESNSRYLIYQGK